MKIVACLLVLPFTPLIMIILFGCCTIQELIERNEAFKAAAKNFLSRGGDNHGYPIEKSNGSMAMAGSHLTPAAA